MTTSPSKTPFTYQYDAAFTMANRRTFGLHDEMGIGKTGTAIAAMDASNMERGAVICPAMLRTNWLKEFRAFSTWPRRIIKAQSIHDYIAWKRDRFDVIIASYEHFTKWSRDIVDEGRYNDVLAMDEAHYLKNVNSKRTRAILGHDASGKDGITPFFEHVWHITGTPLPNDPLDAYTFLRMCDAIHIDQETFVQIFFHRRMTAYGWRHTVKDERAHELQQLLRANSIRRTHGEVGLYLPPIWMKEVVIEGETKDIFTAIADYPYLEEQIIAAIQYQDMSLLNAAHVATIRRLVGKAKAAAYAPMLKAEIEAGGSWKRVSFFCHTEPLLFVKNYFEKYGYKPVVVYGDTPQSRADKAVEDFMNDPSVGPFLGNVRKAGVGLTLTVGSELDMVESDWVPAVNAQAIKRVHRYGQTREVHARFVTLADSIDEAVNITVAEKTAAIAKVEGFAMTAALPVIDY